MKVTHSAGALDRALVDIVTVTYSTEALVDLLKASFSALPGAYAEAILVAILLVTHLFNVLSGRLTYSPWPFWTLRVCLEGKANSAPKFTHIEDPSYIQDPLSPSLSFDFLNVNFLCFI